MGLTHARPGSGKPPLLREFPILSAFPSRLVWDHLPARRVQPVSLSRHLLRNFAHKRVLVLRGGPPPERLTCDCGGCSPDHELQPPHAVPLFRYRVHLRRARIFLLLCGSSYSPPGAPAAKAAPVAGIGRLLRHLRVRAELERDRGYAAGYTPDL